jgi:HEXXH motif-containing protein
MRERLGKALAIVETAWPEAAEEIRIRTRLVLPLDEPGVVSFSLPSRPGVSFINLRGTSLVDLADDLLHETAHHRLHAIEDARPLFRPWRETRSVETLGRDEEPRFWSPWRSAQRPARGLFHACYTFSFRAELFERIIRAARASRGRVGRLRVTATIAKHLASEARKERRLVLRSLRDLERAEDMGLLTKGGRRLLHLMRTATGGGSLAAGAHARQMGQTMSGVIR